jgi:hypothetical protein
MKEGADGASDKVVAGAASRITQLSRATRVTAAFRTRAIGSGLQRRSALASREHRRHLVEATNPSRAQRR